ncbi:MAG: type VI secretion system baseplate subunit TssK [Ancalomicrobiaceae bacterium]|nr:type VI secretion system baseplate subunit TssK [Ancalomicrobiaceae bacterium]
MSATNKLVWLEGMFVRPHHFQQFDRWVESEIDQRATALTPFPWGIRRLEFDTQALALGRIAVTELEAVLPDGTSLSAPKTAPLPPSRGIASTTSDKLLKLAIPVRRYELGDFAAPGAAEPNKRYETLMRPTRDANRPLSEPIELYIARLKSSLILEDELEDDRITLPLARIQEVTPSGEIVLRPTYVPPLMAIGASRAFQVMLREVQVILKSRADAIAGRVDPSRIAADAAGLLDLIALSVINGREALITHFASVASLHPETVYRTFVELVGTLSALDGQRRRMVSFPPYAHDDIEGSFAPVVAALRDLLSIVYQEKSVAIPLQKRGVGIWVGTIADRTLFDSARFILVATSAISTESLRSQLPAQTKASPVEVIRELVNLQLPGIPLAVLPAAPREIPFLRNAVYFELERSGDLWRRLPQSAAFALHSSGDYPELKFELWAVRGE